MSCPPIGADDFSSGMSAIRTLVVRSKLTTDAACWSAKRVTLTGSTTPALIMSTYSPVRALNPTPGFSCLSLSTTTEGSRSLLAAIRLRGISRA